MLVKAAKYDKRQQSKGPYSAIVYIYGSQIAAEDADGEVIASGMAGKDDATVVQAAANRGGDIYIHPGTYVFATAVDITVSRTNIIGRQSEVGLTRTGSVTSISTLAGNINIFNINASGGSIKGITFLNNYNDIVICPTVLFETFTIENNFFYASRNRAISIDTTNAAVQSLFVKGNQFWSQGLAAADAWIYINNPANGITDLHIDYNIFEPDATNQIYISSATNLSVDSFKNNYMECSNNSCAFIKIVATAGVFSMVNGINGGNFRRLAGTGTKFIDASLSGTVSFVFTGAIHDAYVVGAPILFTVRDTAYLINFRLSNCDLSKEGTQNVIWIDNNISASHAGHIIISQCQLDGNILLTYCEDVQLISNQYANNTTWAITNSSLFTMLNNSTYLGWAAVLTLITTGTSRIYMKNNAGYKTEASGTSTGTGIEQKIEHGLSTVPTKAAAIPTDPGATISSVWADPTYIYVTVTAGKAYNWSAEV